ncbi:MAG: nucleotidyltransferase domain-containing protein, partial [Tepidiformaceae bacterium]
TGIVRAHEDIDVSFFPDALPDFRELLRGRYHLWSNNSGTFRLLDDKQPEPLHPLAQIWVRKNAQSPWIMDVTPSPCAEGRWQSKRDAEHVTDLDEVTWVDDRQVRFLNPEVVLLFKAAQNREKDRFDLENAWPLLTDERRQWLRDALRRFDPEHAWNGRLANA